MAPTAYVSPLYARMGQIWGGVQQHGWSAAAVRTQEAGRVGKGEGMTERIATAWFSFWGILVFLGIVYAFIKAIVQSSEPRFWAGLVTWVVISFGLFLCTSD